MQPDFSTITELPNTQVPQEQLERFHQRYAFAASFAAGRRVLEIGCGSGQGLGMLAADAQSVLGLDIEPKNLAIARENYRDVAKVTLELADANALELPDGAFDLVVIFEAIYYIQDAKALLRKVKGLLSPGGVVVIESANREWTDFNPSPYAIRYFSAEELFGLLDGLGFATDLFASYPDQAGRSSLGKLLSLAKRTAVRFGLMPRTMKWKAILKRIFIGRMVLLPAVLKADTCANTPPEPITPGQAYPLHKVLFAVGRTPSH